MPPNANREGMSQQDKQCASRVNSAVRFLLEGMEHREVFG